MSRSYDANSPAAAAAAVSVGELQPGSRGEAVGTNAMLVSSFERLTDENDALLAHLSIERTVRYPQYTMTWAAPSDNGLPLMGITEVFVTRSSSGTRCVTSLRSIPLVCVLCLGWACIIMFHPLLNTSPPFPHLSTRLNAVSPPERLAEWVAPEMPQIKSLPVDLFNHKTDWYVRTFADLGRLNADMRVHVAKWAFFEESPKCTKPLQTLLENARAIQVLTQHAASTVSDQASRLDQLHAQTQALRQSFAGLKGLGVVAFNYPPPCLTQLGVTPAHVSLLHEWVLSRTHLPASSFHPVYQATRDGFASSDFHLRCDGRPRLLVVARSEAGHLFGGFATGAFASTGGYVTDPTAFLFTLSNPHNCGPTLLPVAVDAAETALRCEKQEGPTYGSGADLFICHNAQSHAGSTSAFPTSYTDPTGHGAALFTGDRQLGLLLDVLAFAL